MIRWWSRRPSVFFCILTEGSFNNPSFWKHLESFGVVTTANHIEPDFPFTLDLVHPLNELARILSIRPNVRIPETEFRGYKKSRIVVLALRAGERRE